MSSDPHALLRGMLEGGRITQAEFDQLSGAGPIAVGVGRDNHGNLNAGLQLIGHQHNHHHGASSAPTTDPAALRHRYLANLLNKRNHEGLARLVVDQATADMGLASVYTALLTNAVLDDVPSKPGPEREGASAVALLDAQARLVLLGDPGGGKSSFVNLVALCLAGQALGHEQANLALLTAPLPRPDDEQASGETQAPNQPWRHGALLPVRVELRQLIRHLPAAGVKAGCDALRRQIETDLQAAQLAGFMPHLMQALEVPGVLLLLDGLDEVPDADARREQVREAVQDFVVRFPNVRVLVTARTYAYQQAAWQLPGFAVAEVQPFKGEQISHFVRAWYAAVAALGRLTPADADDRAASLLRGIHSHPRVQDVARRPLLLTLMVQLQTTGQGNTLFSSRQALYDRAVEVLLNEWEGSKPRKLDDNTTVVEPSLSEWLQADQGEIRLRLNELAYQVHARQSGDHQDRVADIPQAELVMALLNKRHAKPLDPHRLMDYLRERSGLLSAQAPGADTVYRFPHRSFQEYLAACWLTNDEFPVKLAALARQDADRWREVLLLAAAKLRAGTDTSVWQLADELCPADVPLPPASLQGPAAWGALLAGQLLCEVLDPAAEPVGAQAPKRERIRQWQLGLLRQASVLPQRDRALAGRQLATLGDPRPEATTLEGMQFVWVPPGPFTMGEGDERTEVDIVYPYAVARFPVTVAQWAEALQAGGPKPEDPDALRDPGNHPVSWVNSLEAKDLCRWLSRHWKAHLPPGWQVTLPTEQEWEKAARGGHALAGPGAAFTVAGLVQQLGMAAAARVANLQPERKYPWGDDDSAERANTFESGIGRTSAVGLFPAGASPYGCEDMAGNVWEWTETIDDELCVLRGGCYFSGLHLARCARRARFHSHDRDSNVGFRVVLRCSPDF